MMIRTFLLTVLLSGAALAPALAASGIESEPLPPPATSGYSAPSTTTNPVPKTGPIPLTPRAGTGTQKPAVAASSSADDGMSGTSGGSSAYDLGTTATSPAEPAPRAETTTSSGNEPSHAAPVSTPDSDPDVPYQPPHSETIRMGVGPKDDPKFETKKFCTLKISFGSFSGGTDQKTGTIIKTYLDSNKDKITYVRTPWGREGEYDYCLDIAEHDNRAKIYTDLKRLIPAKPKSGPVTLSGSGFTTITNAM